MLNANENLFMPILPLLMISVVILLPLQVQNVAFFMASRTFEIPEVMLLIDAVSSAGFITPKKTASLIEKLETLVSVEQAKTMKSQVYVDTSCA